jgi:RNA polymerase sigma-70 factor (ECF subfamily)
MIHIRAVLISAIRSVHNVGPAKTPFGCIFLGSPQKKNATIARGSWSYSKRSSVSAAEDQAAVERVLAGDTAAFEDLVRRWQGPLVNLAFRFCRDRSRAEELAQEAFLRTYRSLAQWRREAAFSTWLFALATNLYRSELHRIPAGTVSLDDVIEPRDSHAMHNDLEAADRDCHVRRAVHALPAKYREALILFYFHEMDIAATARSLSLPEGTVKARLSRGRELLRKKLQHRLGASLPTEEA